MDLLDRPEDATLAETLGGRGPALLVVRGARGGGVSTAVRRAVPGSVRRIWYAATPLADADQRALLDATLDAALGEDGAAAPAGGEPPDWPELLERLRARLDSDREPTVLVLDGVDALLDARSRLPELLSSFWAGVRAHALPFHLVLAGSPALDALAREGPLAEAVSLDLELEPLDFRTVAARVPDWPARERLLAWGVFGGRAAVAGGIDPSVSLATNVRRLVLDPDAPFLHHGTELLERDLQSPARYGSVLRALARGRREWGEVVEAVPDFGSAGQLAPYLSRLDALGWIEVGRSVDAPARSRSRRYRVKDPFLSFWLRYVPPHLAALERGEAAAVWSQAVRPDLDAHMRLHFPRLCQDWLLLHGDEALPARAREVGGLWGAGYDLEVGGTLRTGAAFYGRCLWTEEPVGGEVLDEIDDAVATTRYGFGRESRLRLVFTTGGFDAGLQRRRARDVEVRLVGPEQLLGS